ncbi:M18 family aminopeptidase [Lacisediminihabitans changchengi]|uniref:M18 family aminopeptidase n=1 Tax=Lacisediminihabitans changchengi TaxID=2787634 RepID=A0A934SM87_9MICO|nr:M18 family aminopeptidase [Lacisediminihabitans changchengi]MBK4346911.1 M18 family aminopeptidase [Lacisediminihabitans changchengi]MBK4347966.1 M18 family aminopeptidase [Lacisediminihabitans changchengi]
MASDRSALDRTAALIHLDDLAAFVAASPSSFHAVAEAASRLDAAGFTEMAETDDWGSGTGKHYVLRDGAIIAWSAPASAVAPTPFRIVGTHTDSPGFKLKPKPSTSAFGWQQAGVEIYGGPLYNSWLDRELEFAGRLVFADGSTALVRTGPFLRIPQLAVHLDRSVNVEGLKLNPQQHLNPVIGVGGPGSSDIVGALAALAGRAGEEVAGYDVVVADTNPGRVFGADRELFASGRLDNLSSVHAGLTALLAAADPVESISVFAAFDHEEVGSETRSGAAGPFLSDVLTRLSPDPVLRARAIAGSWCFSADAGHAIHPNYPDRHDPVNRPLVNGGPLLKINANQRYATDAGGAAEWAAACARAGVAYQEFVSNNAVPCGSTIGPITATRLGIRTVDIGIPLLSMHSAREMCGVGDPHALSRALAAFFSPSGD